MRSGTPRTWLYTSFLFGRVPEAPRAADGATEGAPVLAPRDPALCGCLGVERLRLARVLVVSLLSIQQRSAPSSFFRHSEGSFPPAH